MLGAAPETRGCIAAVVEAYRAHGLFRRWPIDYVATHGDAHAARNAAAALGAFGRLGLLLGRYRRLAVHVHTTARRFRRDVPFMSAALAARSPLVVQLHGGGFERLHERALARYFLERAACVIAPCEALRSWVRGLARHAHAVCVPNPVAFAPTRGEPYATRPNLVLFTARLEAAKGAYDLLEAVAALHADIPDVRLVCTGDGERVAVARYAERLGIASAVRFTGWVGPSGKRALLENAAVLALPSYAEALPMSVLEAMSAGVPVVASAVGGIPEVVLDGVSGCLVAPGDIASLERLLRKLLLEREAAARIGAAARESARLRFSPERALGRLEEVYAALGLCVAERPPLAGLRKAA